MGGSVTVVRTLPDHGLSCSAMRTVAGLSLVAILAFTAPAFASDADALIDEGVALREQGKDQEALDRFTRAWSASPTSRARAQMALAEQALGRWSFAEAHLEEALRGGDGWIAKNRPALEGALATVRTHLGDLIVDGSLDGADVSVDGASVGALPLRAPVRLTIGSHVLMVHAAGYFPVERSVQVSSDAPAREHVDLVKQQTASAPPPTDDHPLIHDVRPIIQPQSSDTGKVQRTVGWVLLATTAPFLITGILGAGGRAGQVGSYNSNTSCPGIDLPNQPPQCQTMIDSADQWRVVTIVGFTGAALVAVSSIIVLLTAPTSAPTSPPRVACSFGGCSGTF